MALTLSESVLRLLREPNLAFVATVMPKGGPQVTPVWIDTDGTHIIYNTAMGRQKVRNMERNALVAVSIADRHNAYDWFSIRGRVVAMETEGAEAHVDAMAKKYLNQDSYPFRRTGEQRVVIKILPESIAGPAAG